MYLLRNKDKNLLTFEIIKKETEVTSPTTTTSQVGVAYQVRVDSLCEDVARLPLQMQGETAFAEELDQRLENWLKARKAPESRAFADCLMKAIDSGANPFAYIDVTYGLSLNDSFWVCPVRERDVSWDAVNAYQNAFDDRVARLAFTGVGGRIDGVTTTPEFTTGGALRKCWQREEDRIYLYKGGSERFANGGLEPYMETFAAEIAKAMHLNHVSYELAELHGISVSKCPLFTDENTGFIPMYDALGAEYFQTHSLNDPQTWETIGERYGMTQWEDMLLFDAVIANEDRHLGNFGFLLDTNSNCLKGPAPLFDHGNSLFFNATDEEFADIFEYAPTRRSGIGLTFEEQAKLFLRRRHLSGLQKLTKLILPRHKDPHIDFIVTQLENYLHSISEKLIRSYQE
ncbi:MAG: protein kinase [Negativicoccus succinicivorans]|uniref:protein kinase n=1 Tax=Negativicoccus succinicivorans TaxID=620903 RepID=UPI0029051BBD|nr:protein kinase [Negativicoccus succinicivorans]MDU2643732.1 protein kinase [Negativicoccus succinicivorans]